jgi:hypothetical protein
MVDILKQVETAYWEREFEYVRKHTSQLVCAFSEDMARDAIWASGLARVNTLKCLTHVGHGEVEPTVFGSGPRRGTVLSSKREKVFSLSGSKTSVSA